MALFLQSALQSKHTLPLEILAKVDAADELYVQTLVSASDATCFRRIPNWCSAALFSTETDLKIWRDAHSRSR